MEKILEQLPLEWNNGNFPIKNYIIDPKDNIWYQKGDIIYSIFKIDEKFYASGKKWSKSSVGFAMAFANDSDIPIKNGFEKDEKIYWGVLKEDGIHELNLLSTYQGRLDVNAIFEFTDNILDVNDNPYYSLNPIWPTVTDVRIDVPITTKALTFTQLKFKSTITPKWTTGSFLPEISETNAVLRLAKGKNGSIFLNACTIRFTKEDVKKGFFMLRIYATPLKNSSSEKTFQDYKIYW